MPAPSPQRERPTDLGLLRQRAVALAGCLPPGMAFRTVSGPAIRRGLHGRRRAGNGDSFWQFRDYRPGEPAARIDWRRSARAESLYVREREWESAQDIWFWIDMSPGMAFRSAGVSENKRDRALLLALALAHLAIAAGERVGLYGIHDRAAGGTFGMDRLLTAMERPPSGSLPDGAGLPDVAPLPGRGHLVLLGDFLGSDPALVRDRLQALPGLGAAGHMMQILDPAEEDFPYRGRVLFEGPGAADSLLVNRADDVAAGYRRRLAAWRGELDAAARRAGWTFAHHRTDRSAAPALATLVTLTGQAP